MAAPSAEIQFAQRLAANEKKIRDKALKKLRKYIKSRSASKTGFVDDDLIKLWKGLHYCMWMQDKPLLQEELAVHISRLLFSFPHTDGSLQFFKIFLITEAREWNGIDRLRLDKFMMLVRQLLNQIYVVIKQDGWKVESIEALSTIFNLTLLNTSTDNVPDGFIMHLADIFIPELTKVGWEQLDGKKILSFLKVFDKYLITGKRISVLKRISTSVYGTVARQTREKLQQQAEREVAGDDGEKDDTENEADSDSGYDEDSEPKLKYDCELIADHLFEMGSSTKCCTSNRQRIYSTVKLLKNALSGTTTQVSVTSDDYVPDDDIDNAIERLTDLYTVKKRKRKRKLEEDEDDDGDDNDEDNDVEDDTNNASLKKDSIQSEDEKPKTKKKKKKKKKKKQKLDDESSNAVTGSDNATTSSPADKSSQVDSNSEGKKKKRRKKKKKKAGNTTPSSESNDMKGDNSSMPENINTKDEDQVLKSEQSVKKAKKNKKQNDDVDKNVSPAKKPKVQEVSKKTSQLNDSKSNGDPRTETPDLSKKTPKSANKTPKSSKKTPKSSKKTEVSESKSDIAQTETTAMKEKVNLNTPVSTPKSSLQKTKLNTPKTTETAEKVEKPKSGKKDKTTDKLTSTGKSDKKKVKTPAMDVKTKSVKTPKSDKISKQLFNDNLTKNTPVSEFDKPLEEGETEIWVPSKKYQKKLKAAQKALGNVDMSDNDGNVLGVSNRDGQPSSEKKSKQKKVQGSPFAQFENISTPPAAFVKRALVKGFKTPVKGDNSVKSTPQMTASEKKVKFNLKRNSAQKFEDSINVSPLPAFLPERSPSQGILKTPTTPIAVKMSGKKKKKKSISPSVTKRVTRSRSTAADFF